MAMTTSSSTSVKPGRIPYHVFLIGHLDRFREWNKRIKTLASQVRQPAKTHRRRIMAEWLPLVK
jgi:hypothetical protein